MSANSLDALLERLSSGDAAAAEQAFLEYEPYLRKVVRRLLPSRLRSKFDSQDVVQSTWADLVRDFGSSRRRFNDRDHLLAFLVKATRNRFLDRVRQHHTALDRERPLVDEDGPNLPPAREPRPSEVVQADQVWERLLDLCPPEHHELLRLKRQGLRTVEIAARTGLHEDSIRRLLRGLARRLAFSDPDVAKDERFKDDE
jgi:RNA polymerase sigma-70 factor (ECF subfamily)